MLAPFLFAAMAIGLIAMSKADKSLSQPSPQPQPSPFPYPSTPAAPPAAPPAYAMPANCAAAVQGLPEPLRTSVYQAISSGTDANALRVLAGKLDTIAVMYTEPIASSARAAAQCARDRANALGAGAGPGGTNLIFPVDTGPSAPPGPIANKPAQQMPAFTYANLNDAPAAQPSLGAGSLPGGFG